MKKYILTSLFFLAVNLPTIMAQIAQPFNAAEFFKTFHSETASVNGIRMHYVIGGKGPVIVLIHGWPECWYEWRRVMPLLAGNYTVVSVDLRGAGESAITKTGYDKKTLATDVHELVKHLGYKQAVLVGHDWGAAVAYAYAAQYRSEVSRLVVCEGVPFGKWLPKTDLFWFFTFFRFPGNYAEQSVKGNERAFLTYFYRTAPMHVVKNAISDADMDYYMKYFGQPARFSASLGFYRAIDQDVKDNNNWAMQPLTIPVLAIGGDHQSKGEIEKAMKSVATKVKGIIMKNTGHFVPEERPQAFVGLVRDFLK